MTVGIGQTEIEKHLTMWLKAEEKVAVAGQSYKIGNRTLTRADLGEIRRSIEYWEHRLNSIKGKRSRGARGYNVLIRDR